MLRSGCGILLSVTLVLGGCASDDALVEDQPDPLIEPCLNACGKFACTIDAEPNCEQHCDGVAEQAAEIGDGCSSDLQRLYECHAELGCLEYVDWYDDVPGAQCADEEALVVMTCPGVALR